MNYTKINDEVYYSKEPITTLMNKDLGFLKELALKNPRQRVRLCTHKDVKDKIHEMFIVMARGKYIRPHKNIASGETMQVLEGEVDVILYDDEGKVTRVIEMGDFLSGKVFYYRMEAQAYHTLRIHSPVLCFWEMASGPFYKENIVFSPWSPDEKDPQAVDLFMKDLYERKTDA